MTRLPTWAESGALVTTALDGLRTLQRHADAGWPDGYDAERVRGEAAGHVAVLDAALATMPEASRGFVARSWVQALAEPVVRRATVPLRRKAHGPKGDGR